MPMLDAADTLQVIFKLWSNCMCGQHTEIGCSQLQLQH